MRGIVVQLLAAGVVLGVVQSAIAQSGAPQEAHARPRARDLGINPGVYEPGPHNAITDVPGVRVGHVTLVEGDSVRTGVTAILPPAPGGNLFQHKVAAAVDVFNAFGKLAGSTQVNELGQLETPIVLTNTLSVWDAARALADWELARPGNENVQSINPVVGETNDGWLNDIRGHHVRAEHVRRALETAADGPVEEGSVGAGAGTMAFGWKGGIGTSSRSVSLANSAYTVGVLVQTNFGGHLTIAGVPVWKELQPPGQTGRMARRLRTDDSGSCMMIVATDAPLDARQLRRLAARAVFGMARAGSSGGHGSGDFVIAFSTTRRFDADGAPLDPLSPIAESALSPLFDAAIEATEEAIDNSLLRATTVHGRDAHVAEAVPIDRLRAILRRSGR